ncbi:NAD(P)H-binding protein [Segetibacter koreensis]|uniref:NAD(P)H-binding protein n=1 Tax=Segetibacter koreensis TaxID=398037 RepID=UPI00037EE191|nr:NAD(P)H-binding protein [Segetibacter koreensis]
MQSFTAVVVGATGLIGEQLVQQLLNDPAFSKVRILVRRQVKLSHPKLEVEIVNFDNLTEYRRKLGQGDCIFCCIGTTEKKVKGDKKAYRKIDVDIPLNAAKMGKDAGFTKYLLVSAVGADAHSKNFYLRFKGELEREIADVNFHSFHVFRPSILFGERKEFRLAESIGKGVMQGLSGLFAGKLKKYRGIDSADVARAMVAAAKSDGKGMYVHHYDDMMRVSS